MIKFFRKIRQNLLSERKTGKPALPAGRYFKYAIGEIFLVVIGILIALAINNWNEKQKASIVDSNLISEVVIELKSVKKELETNLNRNQRYLDKMSKFLDDDFLQSEKDSSSVIVLIAYAPSILRIPLIVSILENNVSHSISDTELLKQLRELNTLNQNIINEQSYLDQFWNSKTVEFLIGNEYGHNAFDEFSRKNISISENFRKLYDDEGYKALISLKWGLHQQWVSVQAETLKKIQEILNYLNNKQNE